MTSKITGELPEAFHHAKAQRISTTRVVIASSRRGRTESPYRYRPHGTYHNIAHLTRAYERGFHVNHSAGFAIASTRVGLAARQKRREAESRQPHQQQAAHGTAHGRQ